MLDPCYQFRQQEDMPMATQRVTRADVTVIEPLLTRLSYAPAIAQAMLRQEQASAIYQ